MLPNAVAGASIALSIGLSLIIPGSPSMAAAAPPSEAEEMQRIVMERTGKNVPQVESAPPVADSYEYSKPQRKLKSDQLSDFARELQ